MLTITTISSLAILFRVSTSDTIYGYNKFEGLDCQGYNNQSDILRDFNGTAADCMAKCSELNCDGFVRINNGSRGGNRDGECFFRNGLSEPTDNPWGDDRDCYEPIAAYTKYEGLQCPQFNDQDSTDVLRDFEGTAEECASQCAIMSDCVGFVRVNSGNSRGQNGKCYLRGVQLLDPIANPEGDNRDCFAPTTLNGTFTCQYSDGCPTPAPTSDPSTYPTTDPTTMPTYDTIYGFYKYEGEDCQGTGDPLDILRDYVGNATDCMAKCSELDCDGFVRINNGSQGGNRDGECYFRNGLAKPTNDTYGEDRDCYEAIAAYTKYEGLNCPQYNNDDATDVLRDFEGTAEECASQCALTSGCVGFVRINSGNSDGFDGKCFLRGIELLDPVENTKGDDRDCFVPTFLNRTVYYGMTTMEPTMDPTMVPTTDPTVMPTYDTIYAYYKFEGLDCLGTGDPSDILRDYVGNATDCMAKCSELDCDGFVRVNSGNIYGDNGQCFFRNGLGEPMVKQDGPEDDRDCYEPIAAYTKYAGLQCPSMNDDDSTDVLRDYEGTAEECALKCTLMSTCVGFVRVNSGQRAGLCYLRGGVLQDPVEIASDRDCFAPTTFNRTLYYDGPYTMESSTSMEPMESEPSHEPTNSPIEGENDPSGSVTIYRQCYISLFALCIVFFYLF